MPSRLLDNTYTHTHAHDLISKSHAEDLTAEECASTHTHNCLYFFSLQNAKHYHTYMHAGGISLCQHITAEPPHPSIAPFTLSPHSSHPLLPSIPPFTPARPTARSHTSITLRAHTDRHTHAQRVREGV